MKKNISVIILFIISLGVSYGLVVDQSIENAVSYIKRIIFTTDGTDQGDQKVVIDGVNGSITMSGALNIQEGALKDFSVVTDDIKDAAITNGKIANNSITSDKIVDGSIKKEDLDPSLEMGVFKKIGSDAVYTGGNVGIGIDNPEAKLDIKSSFNNGLTLRGEIGQDYNSDGFYDYDGGALYTTYGDIVSQAPTLHYEEYDNPVIILGRQTINKDTKDAIISMYTGNVGIGTTDPQAKLDVNGNLEAKTDYGDKIGLGGDDYADDSEVYIKAPEERNQVVFWNRTINKRADIKAKQGRFLSGVYTKGADIDYKTLEGQDIEFGHIDEDGNIISRDMIIASGGNVGIGTTSPKALLHINQKDDPDTDKGLVITEDNNSKSIYLHLADNSWGEYGYLDLDGTGDKRTVIRGNGNPSYFMGNVGIGTTSPKTKLDVDGSVIIRGKYSVYRDGGTTIYMIDLNGNKYSLDINGLDDGNWHCSSKNKICYNSHGSSDDAELQFNITDSPSISCTLLHSEDDYASRSKGLYSASDGGNDCAVYTNNGTCFKVAKSGATTSPFNSWASYNIVCF